MSHFPNPDPLAHLVEIMPDGTPVEPSSEDQATFVDDRWIAERIGMQIATVRSQRFRRRHGQKHWLTLDPFYFGSRPRYRRSEALAWLRGQTCEITIEA